MEILQGKRKLMAMRHPPPPSLREGGRERSEQGDARNSPQPPTSFPPPPRHSRNAYVIPADAGTQRKTKHPTLPRALTLRPTRRGGSRTALTPPLRSAKGDASAASRGMPVIHRSTPATSFPRTREPSEKQSTPFPTPHPKNRIISLFPNLYPNLKQSPVPAHIWYFPTVLPTFT